VLLNPRGAHVQVNARSVVRVIISGEWIWVEPGTFTVTDYTFQDDDGNALNRSREPAYHFRSTNGDPYFGPLSAIQLIKLRPPELEADQGEPAKPSSHELPAAGESGQAASGSDGAADQDGAADGEPPAKRKISADELFRDPVPDREPEPAIASSDEPPAKRKISADDLFKDPVPGPAGDSGSRGLL
jgi:hypothetical protein